jgi:C4-dicarboxylate transporter DctM subunit
MLRHQRYPLPFSVALLAASGCAALLIPPTIDLIIIGVVANISIAGLFAGGLLPAALNGFGLIAVAVFMCRRRGYGGGGIPWSTRSFIVAVMRALPAFLLMAAILGGILGGVFTATEAAAIAVVYGLFMSCCIYRELKLSMLPAIIRGTVELTGLVMLIVAMGSVLSYVLTVDQVPQRLAAFMLHFSERPVVFLLLVQVFFLFLGMIMDTLPALYVLMPMLTPIAVRLGIEPIHFGILVEANVALGLITPPVGTVLFTAAAVGRLPVEEVIRPLLPMIAVLATTMLLITYVPDFSMFLPRLLNLTD